MSSANKVRKDMEINCSSMYKCCTVLNVIALRAFKTGEKARILVLLDSVFGRIYIFPYLATTS